jgi:hypothetical protein
MIIRRIVVSMLIGIGLGLVISELSFIILHETARPPRDVILTIPAGTAAEVARGEQPPSIPKDMTFVVGDTLVVVNQDHVDHKLGQLWIPANSSARLALGAEQNMAFECSFQPGNFFGIEVRQALTLGTRIYGILYAGVPIGILILLYSFVIPAKKKEDVPA